MENKEVAINETNKVVETLTKELENLNGEELYEFFKFFYKLNHCHSNMMYLDQFEEFLGSFDSNPFKVNEDKKFRKQLIDAVIKVRSRLYESDNGSSTYLSHGLQTKLRYTALHR